MDCSFLTVIESVIEKPPFPISNRMSKKKIIQNFQLLSKEFVKLKIKLNSMQQNPSLCLVCSGQISNKKPKEKATQTVSTKKSDYYTEIQRRKAQKRRAAKRKLKNELKDQPEHLSSFQMSSTGYVTLSAEKLLRKDQSTQVSLYQLEMGNDQYPYYVHRDKMMQTVMPDEYCEDLHRLKRLAQLDNPPRKHDCKGICVFHDFLKDWSWEIHVQQESKCHQGCKMDFIYRDEWNDWKDHERRRMERKKKTFQLLLSASPDLPNMFCWSHGWTREGCEEQGKCLKRCGLLWNLKEHDPLKILYLRRLLLQRNQKMDRNIAHEIVLAEEEKIRKQKEFKQDIERILEVQKFNKMIPLIPFSKN